jgi:hypothetical protein
MTELTTARIAPIAAALSLGTLAAGAAQAGQTCVQLSSAASLCFKTGAEGSPPAPVSGPQLVNGNYGYNGRFGPGYMRHFKTENVQSEAYTRVCLINNTGQPKTLRLNAPGVGLMQAPRNGSKSCATMPSSLRVHMKFSDRGHVVKEDSMTLSAYKGDIVTFAWTKD